MKIFLAALLAFSPLAAQGGAEYCTEDEVCQEEGVDTEEQSVEYYPGRQHGYYWRHRQYIPPKEEVGNDWPGKMHDPLFDALTR